MITEDGSQGDRRRVCAAVLREGHVLMVKYRRLGTTGQRDGEETWILPGGAVEANETDPEALLRELKEETGLDGIVRNRLFEYRHSKGPSVCYLVEVDPAAKASLGYDPDLFGQAPRLVDLRWLALDEVPDTMEGRLLIAAMGVVRKE